MGMKIKRLTEIRREKHELTIIRTAQPSPRLYCEECGRYVPHSNVGQSATILSLSELAVFRMTENDQIHSTETVEGTLMVCTGSVAMVAGSLNIKADRSRKQI